MSFFPQKCPDGKCQLIAIKEDVFCEYCKTYFIQCLQEDGVCNICGLPFNEDGICLGNEHHLLAWYPDTICCEEDEQIRPKQWIECQAIGYRCSICGAYFGDDASDTICQNGHEIGETYEV